jgi:hypothetical protein
MLTLVEYKVLGMGLGQGQDCEGLILFFIGVKLEEEDSSSVS